jgi:asparagine synthetase B (glutamine-hydrolysing)
LLAHEVWNPGVDEIDSFVNSLKEENVSDVLLKCEGQFVACVSFSNSSYIFCDRLAMQPYYYEINARQVLVYDQLLDGRVFTLNQKASKNFLIFRYVPSGQTLFEGIKQIMPGEILRVDHLTGQVDHHFINVFPSIELNQMEMPEARMQFHTLFLSAIEKRIAHLSATESILLPLSGGYDSRLILAFLLEIVPADRIIAYTFGQQGTYDFKIGKKIAKKFGIRHFEFPLSINDYSHEDLKNACVDCNGQIAYTLEAPVSVFNKILQHGKVILSGNLGNEVMGDRSHPVENATLTNREDIFLLESICKDRKIIDKVLDEQIINDSFYFHNNEKSTLSLTDRWIYINPNTKYTNYCVYKKRTDIDYISPFADSNVFNFMYSLPAKWRDYCVFYFDFFQNWFPEYASLPTTEFRGVAFNSSNLLKKAAYYADHFLMALTGKYFRANKIDFARYSIDLLDLPAMQKFALQWLEESLVSQLLSGNQNYQMLYSLKSLQFLCENFEIEYT